MEITKLNTLVRVSPTEYLLTNTEGRTFTCKTWLEKKGTNVNEHVVLPKDSGTGRQYIRTSHFTDTDTYTFANKETEARTLSSGWRAKLTTEELDKLKAAEATIEELKKVGTARLPEKIDLTTAEGIAKQIALFQAKLKAMKNTEKTE